MAERFLRPFEVANRLNVSAGTVRRLARDGELQSVQIGGQHRFTPEWVEDYLRRQTKSSARNEICA
jgi:excisionase family DNA binding protein